MTWQRRYRRTMLLGSLLLVMGCAAWQKPRALIFSDSELPVWVTKGQTLTVPFDGYLLKDGVLFTCERRCYRELMGLVP